MQIVPKDAGHFEIRTKDTAVVIDATIAIGTYRLPGPGEFEVSGVMAESTPSSVRFTVEDVHLGYLYPRSKRLTDKELERLGAVDVLFFPLGADGLAIKEATAVLAQVDAPMMIPYGASNEELDAFCISEVSCEKQAGPLKLSRSQLPTEGTRVLVFAKE